MLNGYIKHENKNNEKIIKKKDFLSVNNNLRKKHKNQFVSILDTKSRKNKNRIKNRMMKPKKVISSKSYK